MQNLYNLGLIFLCLLSGCDDESAPSEQQDPLLSDNITTVQQENVAYLYTRATPPDWQGTAAEQRDMLDTQAREGHNWGKNISQMQRILDESWDFLRHLRINYGNNYTYTAQDVSWTGSKTNTTVDVENGAVRSRKVAITYADGSQEEISEHGLDINQHSMGMRAAVLDTLYQDCQQQILQVQRAPGHSSMSMSISADEFVLGCIRHSEADPVDDYLAGFQLTSISYRQ